MSKTPVKLTLEEYKTYTDGTDKRYELEDGALLEMPPATGKHEAIVTLLLIYFYSEIQKRGLALQVRPSGTEVQTTNEQSRRPDICIITNEQAQSIENVSAIIQTPPPLVVEVVSPESIDRDYNRKTLEYAAVGIPEYWIVDPLANQVTVCLLNQDIYQRTVYAANQQIVSKLLPELQLTTPQILSA